MLKYYVALEMLSCWLSASALVGCRLSTQEFSHYAALTHLPLHTAHRTHSTLTILQCTQNTTLTHSRPNTLLQPPAPLDTWTVLVVSVMITIDGIAHLSPSFKAQKHELVDY